MIRTVIFDIDGVLVHPWRFRDWLVSEHAISPEMTAPFFRGPFKECVRGRAHLRDVLPPFLEQWRWSDSLDAFLEAWLSVENAPDVAVLDVVAELRRDGVACFTASVQERLRAAYLAREMGFGERFDGLFFSWELGHAKPELEFFRAIESRLDRSGDELLFFDDHPANVDGARAAGWHAEPYTDVARLRADLARHRRGA